MIVVKSAFKERKRGRVDPNNVERCRQVLDCTTEQNESEQLTVYFVNSWS